MLCLICWAEPGMLKRHKYAVAQVFPGPSLYNCSNSFIFFNHFGEFHSIALHVKSIIDYFWKRASAGQHRSAGLKGELWAHVKLFFPWKFKIKFLRIVLKFTSPRILSFFYPILSNNFLFFSDRKKFVFDHGSVIQKVHIFFAFSPVCPSTNCRI